MFPQRHRAFPMWKTSLNYSALKKIIYIYAHKHVGRAGERRGQPRGPAAVRGARARPGPRRSRVVCREPAGPSLPPEETALVGAEGGDLRAPRSHAAPESGQPHSGADRERGGGAAAGPLRGGRRPRQGSGNPPPAG